MPHNLVFGLTLEMTAFGGSRTLLRGPGVTGYTKNTIKIDRHIETLLLMPHYLVFGSTPRGSIKMPEEWHRKKNFKHVSVAFSLNTICQNAFPSPIRSQCDGNVFWQISFPPKAMGTCFGDGNVFYKFKLVKMRRERIYKNAFFGPLKACYGHKGLCTRWGRSHGFRKYP